jgi:hypothetical protein
MMWSSELVTSSVTTTKYNCSHSFILAHSGIFYAYQILQQMNILNDLKKNHLNTLVIEGNKIIFQVTTTYIVVLINIVYIFKNWDN